MAANPYVAGWRAWDERYADHILSKRNWQLAAGGLLVLSLVLAVGLVRLADETVTDIAIGDQERWLATPPSSGDPRQLIAHIALKPQLAGIATNLTVYTTKHIYHLGLRARGHALDEVAFYYPEELLTTMREADAAAKTSPTADASDPSSDITRMAAVDLSQLNFAYDISGPNVAFKPRRAFDDGTHVYLEVPGSMRTSTAPALLIAAGGGTQMVSYRVRGHYYVVDRLFDQAVLVTGVGREQDRVTITSVSGGR
jgi:type IV secretion system protein TrbG